MLMTSDIIYNLLDHHAPQEKLFLRFDNCAIGVRSNSRELIQELKDYYGDFVSSHGLTDMDVYALEGDPPELSCPFKNKPLEPGKKRIKEAFFDAPDGRIVRKLLTGMVFVFNKNCHVGVGPCLQNSNQIINFINNRYINWRLQKKCLLLHAAGIDLDGRGLALAGFAGRGKSTLALHLMEKPVRFVSNDRVLIHKNSEQLSMYGLPKMPRINPGTAVHNPKLHSILDDDDYAHFSNMSKEDLWSVEQKYDVMIPDTFGRDKFVLESQMRYLVILNWDHQSDKFEIQPVDLSQRPDLLSVVRKDPGLFYYPASDDDKAYATSTENYIDFLSHCEVFEFKGKVDFAQATEECFHFLQS
jgi:HprK-related kinase B